MLFDLAGRKPKFISVPVGLMDFIIGAMETIGRVIPSVGVRMLLSCKSWFGVWSEACSCCCQSDRHELVVDRAQH